MRTVLGGTHIGLVRQHNQDRYQTHIVNERLSVAILCDGMGGPNGGGTAAQIAIDYAVEVFGNTIKGTFLENITETSIHHLFDSIFSGANALVRERSQEQEELKGMGTTMVLALLHDSSLYVSWAGDSRAYVAGPTEEFQLTKDHSVVQIMVDDGEISKEEAASHPKKHFITRAVGIADGIDPDFVTYSLGKEDMVLLCSDGLYDYLPKGEIHSLLLRCLQNDSLDILIELANSQGGLDNITAIIMV